MPVAVNSLEEKPSEVQREAKMLKPDPHDVQISDASQAPDEQESCYMRDDHWYMTIIKLKQYRVPEMLQRIDNLLTADYDNGQNISRLTSLAIAVDEFYPVLSYFGHGDSYVILLQFATNLMQTHPHPFTRCLVNDFDHLDPYEPVSQYSELREFNSMTNPVIYLDRCFTLRKIGHHQLFTCIPYQSRLGEIEMLFEQYDMVNFVKLWVSGFGTRVPIEYREFLEQSASNDGSTR